METLTVEEAKEFKRIVKECHYYDHPILHAASVQDLKNLELEHQDFFTGSKVLCHYPCPSHADFNIFIEYLGSFPKEIEIINKFSLEKKSIDSELHHPISTHPRDR